MSSADIEKTEATRNRQEIASGPNALAEAVAQVELAWAHPDHRDSVTDLNS